ncbi:DNA-binding protein [Raoultella ornithinolytica]|uniref:DNA-binding protein n=1 Tax=Raoultella ornithinolytica TaxID=54291 RepID=UPI002DBF8B79|nr:DNA-binding protein [Raoultella ornithinolytica]MEB6461664.1 DNA-binding protein [Raoultella ornithinolytica]
MTTLSQLYKQKDKNGTGTTVKKTFMVPYEELYLEEGDNMRPLDEEHAQKMRDLWKLGADLPALSVQVTERGVKIIDGQHRYVGAGYARSEGVEIPRIECKDFVGTELERLAHQAGSNDGLAITPIQRARQYNRAKNLGHTVSEIAQAFHRSLSDVESHLQLLSSGSVIIGMVESGELAATTAVTLSREHGPKAERVATEALAKAKAAGKKKLTRSAALPQFSATKARQFIQIVADQADIALPDEARAILDAYREFLKEAGWETESGGI